MTKTIILIVVGIILLFVSFVFIGAWLNKRKLKRLIDERNHLDLRTPEGKNRAKVLNRRIDKIYGFHKN
ncbi:MAG TPA: hypothetical protein VFM82_03550 [Flavobacteriaceae bacterium]|nr:hypothetical protein [Flavobacteriaceae bacterium]